MHVLILHLLEQVVPQMVDGQLVDLLRCFVLLLHQLQRMCIDHRVVRGCTNALRAILQSLGQVAPL